MVSRVERGALADWFWTIDRFFLAIRATDPKLDPKVIDELTELGALRVRRVGAAP